MVPEYTYAQSMVTGATFEKMDESNCDPALLEIVQRHLLKAYDDDRQYQTLDKYLVAFFLSCTNSEVLQTLP